MGVRATTSTSTARCAKRRSHAASVLGIVLLGLLLGACVRGDAARDRRPSATAPRDWAARHHVVTGAPLLERRENEAGAPGLAPVPTTLETREFGPDERSWTPRAADRR